MYFEGQGVEKDMEKYTYHSEEAAIGGHPEARHNLGCKEGNKRRFERAVKHFIIAANLGDHGSLKMLKKLYSDGHASKEDYAGALRAYQVAEDATKSAEREKAEEAIKNGEVNCIM
jgi:TPR repeat protein